MLLFFLLVLSFLVSYTLWLFSLSRKSIHLKRIPTVGSDDYLGSYVGAFRYIFDAHGMVQEGYEKYNNFIFKIPTFRGWVVIVNRPVFVDALARASEELSFDEAIVDTLQTDYSLGAEIRFDTSHVDLIRSFLTREAGSFTQEIHRVIGAILRERIESGLTPGVHERFESADPPIFRQRDTSVTAIPAFKFAKHLVQRITSRLLVGPPSDIVKKYNSICERFTNNLIISSHLLKLVPRPLKWAALRYLTRVPSDIQAATAALEQILAELSSLRGTRGCEQNAFLDILISTRDAHSCDTLKYVATRLLIVKMTADHSTTLALTHLLFDLAIHPTEVAEIREEIEAATEGVGWSAGAFKAMTKLDSFVKESQRLSALGAYLMVRKATKDFTFPDGTVLPAGVTVAVPGLAINTSNNNYPEAQKFKAFRFVQGGDATHKATPHSNPQNMVFGYGRHACPGRVIALQILKSVAAHLILHYDMELEGSQYKPPNLWIGAANTPDTHAKLRLRRRE